MTEHQHLLNAVASLEGPEPRPNQETYRVVWQIDMDADSPEEAAAKALIVQRDKDPANTAVVFEVYDLSGNKKVVDLDEETD